MTYFQCTVYMVSNSLTDNIDDKSVTYCKCTSTWSLLTRRSSSVFVWYKQRINIIKTFVAQIVFFFFTVLLFSYRKLLSLTVTLHFLSLSSYTQSSKGCNKTKSGYKEQIENTQSQTCIIIFFLCFQKLITSFWNNTG